MQTQFETELAELIIEAVNLEDVSVDEVDPEAPLFGYSEGSLGLDSIDALEISMAVAGKYDVHLKADDEENFNIFRSLRTLAEHIQSTRA